MTRLRLAVFLIALSLGAAAARPEQLPEYRVKAEFIERFTRFVEWPQRRPERTEFVIGIIGENPFGTYLTALARNQRIKGRSIRIRPLRKGDALDSCDVLFVASSERKNLAWILNETSRRPVLTIGDSAGFASQGVIINFYSAGDQLRFEINEGAAEKSGLRISSKLMKLARVVGEEER